MNQLFSKHIVSSLMLHGDLSGLDAARLLSAMIQVPVSNYVLRESYSRQSARACHPSFQI